MLKRKWAPAAFLVVAPACVCAQSGLTLYGRLDVGVESVKLSPAGTAPGSATSKFLNDTSFWGLRGTEDLGGGVNAYFKLESGINPGTGTSTIANAIFSREAYVGLASREYGNVQIGGQFAPAAAVTGKLDPFQRSMNGLVQNLMQTGAGNRNRGFLAHVDNAVQYISPVMGGFTGRALYAFSEKTVEPRDVGRVAAASVEYVRGPVFAALSFEQSKVASVPAAGSWTNNTVTAGATYDFVFLKVYGLLLRNTLTSNEDSNGAMAGLTIPLGSGTVRTSYATRKVENTAGSRAGVFALGYTYDLSKRTMLYTSYAQLTNGATSNFALWPSSKGFGLPAARQDVRSVEVGVRHFF